MNNRMKTFLIGIEKSLKLGKNFLGRSISGDEIENKFRFLENLIKDIVFNHV